MSHTNDSTLIETQVPSEPLDQKTELEILRLATAQPPLSGPTESSLKRTTHQEKASRDRQFREARCTFGAPSTWLFLGELRPAELAFVSPGNAEANDSIETEQPPLDTRALPEKIPEVWGTAPRDPRIHNPTEKARH